MKIEIVIMSIITYLLLFNSCLTFKLSFAHNIVITIVLFLNIVFVRNQVGSLFVIPMFLILIIYIVWIKKEDWILNVFLIIFSYTLLVIVDNMTHFIWSFSRLNINSDWLVYMIIDYPIFYIICRFMSAKVVQIKNKEFLALSPRIWTILGADMILCMLIFVTHITVTEQSGSSPTVLFSSIVLYVAYFVLTYIMVTTIVREYEINAKIMLKQNSYDNLQRYMAEIEELYQNIRVFRHDYMNIMVSMAGYMEDNNMEGLKRYYEQQIHPLSDILSKEKNVVASLRNLDIVELKSLISVKLNYALEMKIIVNVEITEKISAVNMKSVELVRIMGILLDNAIEASQESDKPGIFFSIIKMEKNVAFIIKNTYVKQDIDYSKLGSLGVSSKGGRRGIGLYNIKAIINEYDNVIMDTEYDEGYFTQLIEIYETSQEAKILQR